MYLAWNYSESDSSCPSPPQNLDNILDNIGRYLYDTSLKLLLNMALQKG